MGLFSSIACSLRRGAEERQRCREQAAASAAARQAERTNRVALRQDGRTDRRALSNENRADRRDELYDRQALQLANGQSVGNAATFDALQTLHGQANYSAESFFGVRDGQTTGGALGSWGIGTEASDPAYGYSVARPGSGGAGEPGTPEGGSTAPPLPLLLLGVSAIAGVLLLR